MLQTCKPASKLTGANMNWVDIRDEGGTIICADPHFYSASRTAEQVGAVLTPFSHKVGPYSSTTDDGSSNVSIHSDLDAFKEYLLHSTPGKRPLEEVIYLSLSRYWNSCRHQSEHLGLLRWVHLARTRSCLR